MASSPSSLSLVLDRLIRVVSDFQFGGGYDYFVLRCDAVECPLQLVFGVQLVGAVQRLPEHGELRRAVTAKFSRDFRHAVRLPLAKDQALRRGTGGGHDSTALIVSAMLNFGVRQCTALPTFTSLSTPDTPP